MAIDNSSYDSLEKTYFAIQEYLNTHTLGPEHSAMIIKHEMLTELLETFDVEALEEQSKDIHSLHAQLDTLKEISSEIIQALSVDDSTQCSRQVADALDKVFSTINTLVL